MPKNVIIILFILAVGFIFVVEGITTIALKGLE